MAQIHGSKWSTLSNSSFLLSTLLLSYLTWSIVFRHLPKLHVVFEFGCNCCHCLFILPSRSTWVVFFSTVPCPVSFFPAYSFFLFHLILLDVWRNKHSWWARKKRSWCKCSLTLFFSPNATMCPHPWPTFEKKKNTKYITPFPLCVLSPRPSQHIKNLFMQKKKVRTHTSLSYHPSISSSQMEMGKCGDKHQARYQRIHLWTAKQQQ